LIGSVARFLEVSQRKRVPRLWPWSEGTGLNIKTTPYFRLQNPQHALLQRKLAWFAAAADSTMRFGANSMADAAGSPILWVSPDSRTAHFLRPHERPNRRAYQRFSHRASRLRL